VHSYCGQDGILRADWQGSLPPNRSFPSPITSRRAFVVVDRLLDQACTSPLHLRRPDIAQLIVDAIHYRQENLQHFQLHSYIVMANHVHLLITPRVEVSKAMHSLKRFAARTANRILTLSGPFWQDESYDPSAQRV
jgi:putative transposase